MDRVACTRVARVAVALFVIVAAVRHVGALVCAVL